MTFNKFVEKSNQIHGTLYNYDEKYFSNTLNKTKIFCKRCNKYFNQRINNHLLGHGCPNHKISAGENKIISYLSEKNIIFETQKTFENCKNIRKLPFDFYLPDYNICIEFDGRQHYIISEYFGGIENYNNISKRDKIKTKYCLENNIKLLRIKYNENIIEKINENI
jgi:very-short-patch-repair endonuclease